MRGLSAALVGAFTLLLPVGGALAADYNPPPVIEYPPVVPVEIGSGWYLRGDVGYKKYRTPDAHFDVVDYGDMIEETISDAGTVGIGFGYRFNSHMRMDLTLDYEWPGEFHGRLPCPGSCQSPYSDEFASFTAWTFLVNAYYDFGKFGAFTPYVGAGVGASAISTRNVYYINPDQQTGTWTGATKWNLAWALMVGSAVDISRNWALDFNYRYLHLGDAKSGPTSQQRQPINYDGLAAHEFRVGLRYYIR